jgi:hypothetical protein
MFHHLETKLLKLFADPDRMRSPSTRLAMTFRALIVTHRIEDERSMGYLRAPGRSL